MTESKESAFIGRQPILDRQNQIIGYELFYRSSGAATTAGVTDDLSASLQVLANLLMDMGTNWVLGDKLAFINVTASALNSEFLELMPPQRIVLELARETPASGETQSRLEELEGRGFNFCLDNFDFNAPTVRLLPFASYVKLDQSGLSADEFQQTLAKVDPRAKNVIASRVETKDAFQTAARLGAKYFQGYYFARPVTLGTKVVNPSVVTIMDLLRLLRESAEVRKLEDLMKRDPTLSFKLLRYINSPAVGLRNEISSFRQALTMLGYEKLYKWLTLVLVTAGTSSAANALAKTALTRGLMAEEFAEVAFTRECADELFMVGTFSLLDVMLETPKQELFEKVALPPAVRQAIVSREGAYAPVLDLIELCEQQEFDRLAAKAEALGIPAHAVNHAHLNALARAEKLAA